MKAKNIIVLFSLFLLSVTACKKDYVSTNPAEDSSSTPVDLSKPISFKDAVVPIFTNSCLGSACHSAGGVAPVLTSDKAYDQLTGLGYVDAATPDTVPANSKLYIRMAALNGTKPMPPAGKLTSKLQIIELWIKQGSNNN